MCWSENGCRQCTQQQQCYRCAKSPTKFGTSNLSDMGNSVMTKWELIMKPVAMCSPPPPPSHRFGHAKKKKKKTAKHAGSSANVRGVPHCVATLVRRSRRFSWCTRTGGAAAAAPSSCCCTTAAPAGRAVSEREDSSRSQCCCEKPTENTNLCSSVCVFCF